jgi:subfamily B ATP-binding cassette protein MsbA
VGPSGSGKTSLLYLILRLYDPTTGSVLVDGFDLKNVRLLSYRNQLGVVLQDTFLFSGTVRENIRYGNLKASDADVEEAARMAALYDGVIAHPEGFERDIGEGTRLSGGQKQRIGIARALIRDPAVLILDEATSNLDSRSEQHIMDTIWNVSEGRTTVMVSHRLMTVQKADRIYVLDQGRIVENGTHDDLLTANGLYRRIWDEQMQLGTDVDAAD